MSTFIDYQGQRFGRLLVVQRAPNAGKTVVWRCQCDCGEPALVRAGNLRSGNTQSCGCERNKKTGERSRTHGHSAGYKRSPELVVWKGMISRTTNPNNRSWDRYGGRGITVCERWRVDFGNFYADMGPRPSARHSIDRIDNNGNYEPDNCRWALPYTQTRNTRRNRKRFYRGKAYCLAELAELAGINYSTMKDRLLKKWPIDKAVETPARKINRMS